MNWVLIIITFYQPHADIRITEMETNGPEDCLARMTVIEQKWEAEKDADFKYNMRCERRGSDANKSQHEDPVLRY